MPDSILSKKQEEVLQPDYSSDEQEYIGAFQSKLESAAELRDSARDEFDGMPYLTYFDKNEKLANTFIGAKKNKSDTNYQSGTVRTKLFAFLSAINKMNLEAEISAFNKENLAQEDLGNAMTTILRKSEELDHDDEKRINRQFELLKQGTVFIEDVWVVKKKTEKKLSKKFEGKLDAKWSEKLVEASAQCERTILWGSGVYLGSMSEYYMKNQPYIYTVDVVPFEVAKGIFGEWDRFKYVSKKLRTTKEAGSMYNNNWRLTNVDEDKVEVIRYQNKWNDELQIVLNGVLMLPIGFPLTSISPDGEYTIVKQVLEAINHKFPYGKSLPMKLRTQVGVYDELIRLGILKSQKSFQPPRGNLGGKVVGKGAFMPGVISMGLDPNKIPKLDPEDRGMNTSELGMIQFISDQMDDSSVKSQQATRGDTATETLIVQEEANKIIGLTLFMMGLLEKKLADKRIPLLLENYTQPLDTKLNEAKNEIVNTYRTANVETPLPDRGLGRSIVQMSENIGQNDILPPVGSEEPERRAIFDEEEAMEAKIGQPVRIIRLNPVLMRKRKSIWETNVSPTPNRNSNTDKLMFRAKMADAMAYFPNILNISHWANSFAQTWGDDPSKAFNLDQASQNVEVGQLPSNEKKTLPQATLSKTKETLLT